MAPRGPKSAASMEIVIPSSVEVIDRARPPRELTSEQAAEWVALVERMPADWFPRETQSVHAHAVRRHLSWQRIAQLVAKAEKSKTFDLDEYDQLLKMQEREGRAISSLATWMRLTQQATVRAELARKPTQISPPWEDDD